MNQPLKPPAAGARNSEPAAAERETSPSDLDALLGARPALSPRLRRLLLAAAGIVLVAAAALGLWRMTRPADLHYVTEPLKRGDLLITVSATGALEPVNQVDIGSELSGVVDQVLVEENDTVRSGQVLATLDRARLRDQVVNAEAALASAKAGVERAKASLEEAAVKASRLHRLAELTGGDAPARIDLDAADAALARAKADVSTSEAAVRQAAAALNTGRTNLGKAVIRSPIDGVVLVRKVEPGQTVAASLQAPVLFTLAEDMRRMELHVDIDEADVGQVRQGQSASFAVDAYPGRSYAARLTRVGYGSQTKEGVVTYTGVLAVDNADLSLRPGMTANVEIASDRRSNVLLAPVAALQFRPSDADRAGTRSSSPLTPRMPRFGPAPRRRSSDPGAQQVWILEDRTVRPVTVRAGATDGRQIELQSSELAPGMQVVTAERAPKP
jgi:HlyD family secretion protein